MIYHFLVDCKSLSSQNNTSIFLLEAFYFVALIGLLILVQLAHYFAVWYRFVTCFIIASINTLIVLFFIYIYI